jgi:hypothetical protein
VVSRRLTALQTASRKLFASLIAPYGLCGAWNKAISLFHMDTGRSWRAQHPSDGRGGCRACLAEIGQSALLNHPHGSTIAIGFYAGY